MRAKMKITSVTKNEHNETVHFEAVAASGYPADGTDENNTYAKFTPSGQLSLTITNPDLLGKFEPGKEYYLDFSEAN